MHDDLQFYLARAVYFALHGTARAQDWEGLSPADLFFYRSLVSLLVQAIRLHPLRVAEVIEACLQNMPTPLKEQKSLWMRATSSVGLCTAVPLFIEHLVERAEMSFVLQQELRGEVSVSLTTSVADSMQLTLSQFVDRYLDEHFDEHLARYLHMGIEEGRESYDARLFPPGTDH